MKIKRILGAVLFSYSVALCALAEPEFVSEGITEPVKDEILSALVSGLVRDIHFKEGDAIKKNDVIIVLEQKVEELEVARRKLIWDSKVEVTAAKRRAATLRMDFEATKRLYETTKSVSKDDLANKELEYMMAVADHDRLKIEEEREEIEFEMSKEQLKRRQIIAPLGGVITKIFLQEGEICEVNQPLVRIVDTSQCYFVSHVDAKTSPDFTPGQTVALEINRGKTTVAVVGTVSFVSPIVDPASGLREVKVRFDNINGTISPGVTGVLRIDD